MKEQVSYKISETISHYESSSYTCFSSTIGTIIFESPFRFNVFTDFLYLRFHLSQSSLTLVMTATAINNSNVDNRSSASCSYRRQLIAVIMI